MHRFQTTAVHAGREDFGDLCVHAPPLDLSTTYPIADLDVGSASFDALVGGHASAANPIYARLHNPTVGEPAPPPTGCRCAHPSGEIDDLPPPPARGEDEVVGNVPVGGGPDPAPADGGFSSP